MIVHGDQVRLTPVEQYRLRGLSGSDPSGIRTRRQLDLFVRAHLVNYSGRSPEERLLRSLLASFIPDSPGEGR